MNVRMKQVLAGFIVLLLIAQPAAAFGGVLWETTFDPGNAYNENTLTDSYYIPNDDSHIRIYSTETGEFVANNTQFSNDGVSIAGNDTMVVATNNEFTQGINPATGDQVWVDASQTGFDTAFYDGQFYIVDSAGVDVYTFDGSLNKSYSRASNTTNNGGEIFVNEDGIYVARQSSISDNRYVIYDHRTDTEVVSKSIIGSADDYEPNKVDMIVDNDTIYHSYMIFYSTGAYDGETRAYTINDGSDKWVTTHGEEYYFELAEGEPGSVVGVSATSQLDSLVTRISKFDEEDGQLIEDKTTPINSDMDAYGGGVYDADSGTIYVTERIISIDTPMIIGRYDGFKVAEPTGRFTLNGTVTNETGSSVENVTIRLDGETEAQTTTDGNGTYEITGVLSGEYTLTAEHPDYALATKQVTVEDNTTVDFELTQNELVLEAPEWIQPGKVSPYTVYHIDYKNDTRLDVTENATVISSNNSVVDVLSTNELQGVKGVNDSATVTAYYNTLSDNQTVVVAERCIGQLELMPESQRVPAYMCIADGLINPFFLLFGAAVVAAAAAYILGSTIGGIAAGTLALGSMAFTGQLQPWYVGMSVLYLVFAVVVKKQTQR